MWSATGNWFQIQSHYNKIEQCTCCAVISLGNEIWYQCMHYYYQIYFLAFGLRKILAINHLKKALSKRTTIHNLNHQLMFTNSITYQQILCSFIFSKHLSHSTKLNYFTIVSSSIVFTVWLMKAFHYYDFFAFSMQQLQSLIKVWFISWGSTLITATLSYSWLQNLQISGTHWGSYRGWISKHEVLIAQRITQLDWFIPNQSFNYV